MKVPPPTADAGGVVAAPGTSRAPRSARAGGDPDGRVRCGLCPTPAVTGPPVARRAPHEHVLHGVTRPDPYAWMSPVDGEHPPELLDHLAAERGWYDLATTHLDSLASVLRSEMVARVPEERRSGTWSRMRFSYYTRDARNRDYSVIWRESRNDFAQNGTDSTDRGRFGRRFRRYRRPPEVVLDVNTLDAGTGYLDLGLSIVSPDENLLAYSVDTSGDEVFTLRFRDLRTGADLPDVVEGVGYTGAWTVGLRRPSSTRSPTSPGARSGSACTGSALPPPTTSTCSSSPTAGSRSPCGAAAASRRSWCSARAATPPRAGTSTPPAPTSRRARSAAGGRAWSYRAEHVRAPRRGASCSSPTTTRSSSGWCPAPCPGRGGQDHTTWREVETRGPEERLERVDAFEGYVVTQAAP